MGQYHGPGYLNKTTRPSYITNELITLVKGAHTIKMGGEYRHLQQVFRNNGNQSGTVNFTALSTAQPGISSGDAFASMLVGAVDNGNLAVYNIAKYGALQQAFALHIGDTWKVSSRLTLNYGLRWDKFTPTSETGDHLAFFSFAPNPGAGGLPGSLAYAGSKWGSASAGKPYPESPFNGGFGPRIGLAYKLDNQTVIRAGYGVFYTQAFYPGWGGGMNLDGFNPQVSFGDSLSGYQPAFYLDNGFPAYSKASDISATADNGKTPTYRPPYGNHLSYTQQWNLTVERKIGNSAVASVAYVANKGTHLPSQMQPLNYLNPSLLTSMGAKALNTAFTANGPTTIDGVSVPYSGWVQQLTAAGDCAPTVAQALVQYPQFCGGLIGLNENEGTSMYNSFQTKIEKQFAGGFYAGANYTYSHLTTDASSTTQSTAGYGGIGSVISPYQGSRNTSISPDDQPHSFALMAVYDLPLGSGKRFLNRGGWLNQIVGNWTLASSMKLTSGLPFYFRDSTDCGLPSQIQAACIPGISGKVLAQSWSGFNVNQTAFNASAFESAALFNGNYLGTGPRVSTVRGDPYRDVNLSLSKKMVFKERLNFEIRAEAFNALNNHYFTCDGQAFGDCIPFNNDPSSPYKAATATATASGFGSWNGTVTQPRNVQLVARFTF